MPPRRGEGLSLEGRAGAESLNCIREVHGGATVGTPAVAAKLAGRVSGAELTEREFVVLRALATGQSNKEIGRALFISEATVKAHLKSIFAKLNVLDRIRGHRRGRPAAESFECKQTSVGAFRRSDGGRVSHATFLTAAHEHRSGTPWPACSSPAP